MHVRTPPSLVPTGGTTAFCLEVTPRVSSCSVQCPRAANPQYPPAGTQRSDQNRWSPMQPKQEDANRTCRSDLLSRSGNVCPARMRLLSGLILGCGPSHLPNLAQTGRDLPNRAGLYLPRGSLAPPEVPCAQGRHSHERSDGLAACQTPSARGTTPASRYLRSQKTPASTGSASG